MNDRHTLPVGKIRQQLGQIAARLGRLAVRRGEHIVLFVQRIVEQFLERTAAQQID